MIGTEERYVGMRKFDILIGIKDTTELGEKTYK